MILGYRTSVCTLDRPSYDDDDPPPTNRPVLRPTDPSPNRSTTLPFLRRPTHRTNSSEKNNENPIQNPHITTTTKGNGTARPTSSDRKRNEGQRMC